MIVWLFIAAAYAFVSGFFACCALTVYLDKTLPWPRYACVAVAFAVIAIGAAWRATC